MAIRSGFWKLVHFYEDDRRELYDLSADPGESNNLASQNPAKADELYRLLTQWRQDVGANAPTLRNQQNDVNALP